ncbi:uridine kinase [Candida albicans]|uniref:Uridine kinase n=3 Tax=Candida TaxID=5475 RepID=A0A8H6C5P8_CANAX|nr:uridine kinase [Candida albicans]KGQ92342.1 uridine kinase [Candida albicans P37005]KGR12805.1 uridine kinase [Candida albicans P78048]KGR17532.1 uridine kinase [Candida albicans P37037]KGT69853.1 uridine kinase [Candida albicans 12C]KGU10850.1 uridine kinase [Candida albicans 19F]KHC55624.1 uridine kinase [Candida albicans P37039]
MPLHPKSRRRSSRISPLPDEDSLSFINSSVENLDQSPFESIDDLVEDVNKYDLKSLSDEQRQQSQQESQTQNLKHKPSFTSTPKASYIPPWTEPYIIGIAGNSGSGKTSISQKIIQDINQPWTVLLSFDNFYQPLTSEQSKLAFANNYDFDCPDSLDFDLLVETIGNLKKGGKTTIPVYSFTSHNRTSKTNTIYGANVIIVEGLYALHDQRLLDMMDLKIYVDTDLDICLARRLTRDILYRGRDLGGAMQQWEKFVKPNAVKFINPTVQNADLVIPRGLDNSIAINLMIKHIKNQLALKSRNHLQRLKKLGVNIKFDIDKFNIKLLQNTNQVKGINSILFDTSTSRNDFIFYFNRMCGLLIELAQEFMTNYTNVDIDTGKGIYHGKKLLQNQYNAVNIIRSGDCFMASIKKSFPEISIGKLLIQSDSTTGEPQLHFERLPHKLSDKIMLFDSQIISGAGAIMAIQVLLDHHVKEQDIILITYLSTEIGIRRIVNVFPKVKIVVGKLSSMEDSNSNNKVWYNNEGFLDSHWHFRNRFIDSLYFGTE